MHMSPIPIGPGVDLTASLQFIALLALIGLFVFYGLVFWMLRRSRREYTRLRCPVEHCQANIVFSLADDGSRVDVEKCSLFGERAVTCGKHCLDFGAAVQA
jgi:hypothetical protein